jgi:hypothetical protein
MSNPLATVDIYMDDFLRLAQHPEQDNTQQAILHSIDAVFRSKPHPDDSASRKTVISQSKLHNGDGTWATKKVKLGWSIDSSTKILKLPQHKADRLLSLLDKYIPLCAHRDGGGNNYWEN